MPQPANGEFLVRNEWISVDPYMRGRLNEGESYVPPFEIGEFLEWTCTMAMRGSLKATLDCATAFATTDFLDELKSFDKPTLIVHETDDKTVPIDASGRAAAAGISNLIIKEYDGAPHGLTVTHKQQLTDDLLAFLKS